MTMGSRTAHAFREVKISGVRVGVVPSIFVELRFTVETARAERAVMADCQELLWGSVLLSVNKESSTEHE